MRRGIKLRYIVGGFVFLLMSKPIELRGDIAPEGSGERLGYHLLALLFVIFALVSFIRGVISTFRSGKESAPRKPSRTATTLADAPEPESGFDPDAALARYMQAKGSEAPPQPQPQPQPGPPRPQGGGFGRKAV